MVLYNPQEPIIYLHIPNCAGTYVRKVLSGWFKDNAYPHDFSNQGSVAPVRHALRPGICIHGHFNIRKHIGVQEYYPCVKQFLAIIRDPFDIVVAHYFYAKARLAAGDFIMSGRYKTFPESLDAYLKQEICAPDYRPNMLNFMPLAMNCSNYKVIIEQYFVYIGLVEDLQFSVNRIAACLGFRPEQVPANECVDHSDQADKRVRQEFIKAHPLEYALYEYVAENYKKW
ncbi:MAG: hypothetical protein KBA46_01990 [Candidatus Omnitrophica bacterium]|nr:hypothetical protein [Candidatus Omnitrophota bacterium]